MAFWKKVQPDLKANNKKHFEKGKQIRSVLSQLADTWPDEVSLLDNCLSEYSDFYEKFDTRSKQERQINNLLVRVPESSCIDFNDVERLITKEESSF